MLVLNVGDSADVYQYARDPVGDVTTSYLSNSRVTDNTKRPLTDAASDSKENGGGTNYFI